MTFGAVINRRAGAAAQPGDAHASLQAELESFIEPACIRWTTGANAREQAAELVAAGVDTLLAGGGDGTINTVAAVATASHIPLAVLPLGTLNHFARDIGIPQSLPEAIAVARRRQIRRIDVGEVNGRIFLNNVSLGIYPVLVAQREKHQRLHGWRKFPAQLLATWRVLRRLPMLPMSIEFADRRITHTTPMLFIGNNAYDAGVLSQAKRQALDTGKLWICMAATRGATGIVRVLWGIVTRPLDELPDLETEAVDSLVVHARRRTVRVAIDGETCRMRSPLQIRSLPGALEVIAP